MPRKIIDTDAHLIEPEGLFEPYMRIRSIGIEGEGFRLPYLPPNMPPLSSDAPRPLDASAYASDRINVLHPTAGLYAMCAPLPSAELDACARAYNAYARAYTHGHPHLRYTALIPPTMQATPIAQLAATDPACVGFSLNPAAFHIPLSAATWIPLFDVASRTGRPFCLHTVTGSVPPTPYMDTIIKQHMLEPVATLTAALVDLILSPALTRFPHLRVGLFEAGSLWHRAFEIRVANHLRSIWNNSPALPLGVENAMYQRVYYALDNIELEASTLAGVDQSHLLFATDIPHADALPFAAPPQLINDNAYRFFSPL